MKIIGAIVAILVVVILAIVAVALTRPDSFRVQRSIAIKAPPEKIFALIDDFHQWSAWSPYEKLDPGMKRTYGGAPSGVGATYSWESQGKAGVGGMEITKTSAPNLVTLSLNFTKPMKARNMVDFTLEPQGETTKVTWAMYGPSPLAAKVMGLFVSMDSLVGKDFETGLANLKAVAER
jgi:uncharacterized protein YndB with AHSA1/START domain